MYNAIRFSATAGSDHSFGGRSSLNNLFDEVCREPHLDAMEEVAEAANTFKQVSWEAVRNICNVMTNQLYLGGPDVDIEQAHMSTSSFGGRYWELEHGRTGKFLSGGSWGGWWTFDEQDVRRLCLTSGTSGSGIEATKIQEGNGNSVSFPQEMIPRTKGVTLTSSRRLKRLKTLTPNTSRVGKTTTSVGVCIARSHKTDS
jgi:hypothetical protein